MSDLRSRTQSEPGTAIQAFFFDQLAEIDRDLIQLLADLALHIDDRNVRASLIHMEVESRVQAVRNILLVFRAHLGD